MSLKQKVTEYLELLDSPGYSPRTHEALLAELAEEVGYETPKLTQEDIAAQGAYVDSTDAE